MTPDRSKRHCWLYLRLLLLLVSLLLPLHAVAVEWLPFGPYGGDARSFAADPKDPKHIYLGSIDGWIYDSQDGGSSWKRLARLGNRDDYVVDHIVVDAADSKHLLAGVWVLGQRGGGLFESKNEGRAWVEVPDLKGQSVRSLSGSPSDPKTYVAGTLEGVYRTTDGGDHWRRISPEGSKEIHEIESVAVDPKDASVIYAGTWHLPWKTSDAGEHWNNIKEGVIDDSDVFSIIVDPKDPSTVYVSACSGIYKSDNGGDRFQKVQGIPSTARRTRVLRQNPVDLGTVYAGTTEGLFRTIDAGKNWMRTTGPEVIVNDVYIDPGNPKHILVATDRGGVLASEDGGTSFEPSNTGFTVRQVVSYVADAHTPSTVYVGVINDKDWGGVFESRDGSLSWQQQSTGLGGRDVFSLGQASDGTLIAGTNRGLFRWKSSVWDRVDDVDLAVEPAKRTTSPTKARERGVAGKRRATVGRERPSARSKELFDASVFAIATYGDTMYAATSEGVLKSGTAGASWLAVPGLAPGAYQFVAAERGTVLAGSLRELQRSSDEGASWSAVALPPGLTQISALAADDEGGLWVGAREGVWRSKDSGASWSHIKNLFVQDASNIFFDRENRRIYVAADQSTHLASMVQLPEMTVRFWDTGWNLRFIRPMGDHLVGGTMFDGMVVQPRMVDSLEAKPPQGLAKVEGRGSGVE